MKITKTRLIEIIKEEVIKEVGVDEKTRYLVRAFSPNPRKRGQALIFQVFANSPEEAIEIAKASRQIDDLQPIKIIKEEINKYAICTASVGRENEKKYKSCKEKVAKQNEETKEENK